MGWVRMGIRSCLGLLSDRVKLLAYRIFDPVTAGAKSEAKAAAKPDSKPDAKVVATPDAKAEPKPETKAEAKPDPKANAKPETEAEPKPDVKAETPSDLTPQISKRAYELYEKRGRQGDQAGQDWDQAKREIGKDETKTKLKPEVKNEVKPGADAKASTDLTPQLVKRVHDLYEELGAKMLRPFRGWRIQSTRPPKMKPRSSQNQPATRSLKGGHDHGSELASLALHFRVASKLGRFRGDLRWCSRQPDFLTAQYHRGRSSYREWTCSLGFHFEKLVGFR